MMDVVARNGDAAALLKMWRLRQRVVRCELRLHPTARVPPIRLVSVAPGTETTDREVPVDAHAPHVVG
jgi:hypothetical protein